MITLNTERGFVRIEHWEQVEELPGFDPMLNPLKSPLKQILGAYALPSKHPCGLSICRTGHLKGYVVQTEAGAVTNIGHQCGSRYFLVNFDLMAKAYDRDLRAQDQRDHLTAVQHQLPTISARLTAMKGGPDGANWIDRTLKVMRDPQHGLPRRVLTQVDAMARRRDPTLTKPRLATAAEIDMLTAQGQRVAPGTVYMDEVTGHLAGLAALYPENSLRKLLVDQLAEGLQTLGEVDVTTLTDTRRRDLAKWSLDIEPTLAAAQEAVAHGRRWLTQSNLEQLDAVTTTKEERRQFSAFIAALPAGGV
jgi:hypothetical protein